MSEKYKQIIRSEVVEKAKLGDDGRWHTDERESKKLYSVPEEPAFVKLYLASVLKLKDLPKGYSGVLGVLLRYMPWADKRQAFAVNKALKEDIAEELGVTVRYVERAITQMIRNDLIFRLKPGYYQFNPYVFGKGEWKDISEIRLNLTFSAKVGMQMQSEVQKA